MARHLITSALPYINGIKHLGNMVGSMLPADVYSRYLRQRGHDVLYICATDEHGTPAELAAKEQGLPVAEFCAQAHDAQKAVYDGFALAFDYFGRSSSPENREITQHFARKLNENGFIEERAIRQVYSPADGRFLPDRYVEGTCPPLRLRQGPRRPVRELHPRPGPDRPDQPAQRDLRLHGPGGP
ncbi:class I tRNA ligase family protein [Streptomyces tricolor]|nr:class I tRNA ligase family protein [Streptomyces tricolor]